ADGGAGGRGGCWGAVAGFGVGGRVQLRRPRGRRGETPGGRRGRGTGGFFVAPLWVGARRFSFLFAGFWRVAWPVWVWRAIGVSPKWPTALRRLVPSAAPLIPLRVQRT